LFGMQSRDLRAMSLEELWTLHEELTGELSRKIRAEKAKLEDRLSKLQTLGAMAASQLQRSSSKVAPKYRDPNNPLQTWAGRGKQPRWLQAQLRSGKKLADFLIDRRR
jgi:DNA-binding protein H-NS